MAGGRNGEVPAAAGRIRVDSLASLVVRLLGWDSDVSDFEVLKRHIEPCIGALISTRVRRAAHEKVNVLVFGIDVGPDAQTGALAELIVVYDLASSGWHVTGKSFLRGDQRGVVRVQNLMSHFVVASDERSWCWDATT